MLTFTMAEASILSGAFKHDRNIPFVCGVLIGVATSFKLSIYIETTQKFLKTSQSIVIGILVLKLIELIFGAVPGFFMGAVVSLAAVGLGALTFLLVPLTLTFITELTHPVVTHIPQLLIFWITAFTAVIISKRSIWFENIPLAVSAVLVMLTRESDGWESLRQELSSPALKKKLLDHDDDA